MPSREAVSSEMAMGQAHRLSGGDAKDAGSNDAKGKQYFPSMREYKSALLDLFRVKSTIDATAQEAVAENTCSALMLEAHGGLGAESSFASHVTSRHASVAAAKHTSLLPSMIEHSHDSRTAQRSKLSIIGGRGALTDYEDADIFRVQSHTQRPMVCNDVLTIGRSPKRAQTKPSAHAACSLHTSNQLHAPHEDTASHVGSPQSQSETDEHALTSLSTTPTAERRMRASFQTGEAPAPASPGPGSQGALASWHMPARVRRRSVEMSSVEPQGQSGGSDGMHELPAIPGAQLSPQQHTANGGSKRSSSVSQSSHYSNEAANQDALCRDHALLPALNRKGGGYALPPATKEDTGQAGRAFFPELGSMVPSASSGPQLSIASKLQLKGPAKNLGGQSGSPPHKVHVATAHSEGSICLDGTKRRGSQLPAGVEGFAADWANGKAEGQLAALRAKALSTSTTGPMALDARKAVLAQYAATSGPGPEVSASSASLGAAARTLTTVKAVTGDVLERLGDIEHRREAARAAVSHVPVLEADGWKMTYKGRKEK